MEHAASHELVSYVVTGGSTAAHGLQTTGVAQASGSAGGDWSFDRLEVALPSSSSPLAAAMLRYYLSPTYDLYSGVAGTLQNYFSCIDTQNYQSAWYDFSSGFKQQTTYAQ